MTYVYQPYPRSLYRHREDGHDYNGVPCEVLTVESAEEEAAAKADGYHNSPCDPGDVVAAVADLAASVAKFDHDGDGRPGGSRKKVKRK